MIPEVHRAARATSHFERRWTTDAIVAAVIAVAALALGGSFTRTMRQQKLLPEITGLEQQVFGAALMDACGRGFVTPLLPLAPEPKTPPQQLAIIDFLAERRDALSCADIPADVPTAPLTALQRASPYLMLVARAPWRLSPRPSWAAIDWLLGAMFAVSIVLTYAACRALMGRAIATLVSVTFMLSPLHVANIINLRDYSKTPFFAASLLFMALLLARLRPARTVLAIAAVAGAVLGFGFGMRTDVALNLALFVLVVALFLPERLAASWKLRLAAVAVSIASFAIVAAPALASREAGGDLWHWALLGYAHDFDTTLGVDAAPYEPVYFYFDTYIASVVDAYWGRTTGSPRQVSLEVEPYAAATRSYYKQIVSTFPADTLLRAYASTLQVARLPFTRSDTVTVDVVPDVVSRAMQLRTRLFVKLRRAGLVTVFGVLVAAIVMNARLGAAMFLIVGVLGAYPAVQYQPRHVFHLELIPLMLLGVAGSALLTWLAPDTNDTLLSRRVESRDLGHAFGRAAVVVAAVALLVAAPLMLLRAYQQRSVTALLASYERARLVAIPTTATALADGQVRIADAAAILRPDNGQRAMWSEQVVLETAPRACRSDRVLVTFRYAETVTRFDYSRTIPVPIRPDAPTRLFFTVYQSGTASLKPHPFVFTGIEVPGPQADCVGAISRFDNPDAFPLLISAILPAGWQTLPLHQTLRGVESPWSERVRRAAQSQPDESEARARFTGPR